LNQKVRIVHVCADLLGGNTIATLEVFNFAANYDFAFAFDLEVAAVIAGNVLGLVVVHLFLLSSLGQFNLGADLEYTKKIAKSKPQI
jgi:hypothetical protein